MSAVTNFNVFSVKNAFYRALLRLRYLPVAAKVGLDVMGKAVLPEMKPRRMAELKIILLLNLVTVL